MLFVLSPAKSLDYESPLPAGLETTEPLFPRQSAELIRALKKRSASEIGALMDISPALAELNVARYRAWSGRAPTLQGPAQVARQAALAFDGDVYGGLSARTLAADQLAWAQTHLCILSGLYGVLRPLDRLQPYRLEMGTALETAKAANLYQFWGARIAQYLNERAAADTSPVVVNLASEEYFKSVDRSVLKPRVVACVFEDFKGGKYKIISFNAKRARGLMARFAIERRIATVRGLEGFAAESYRFDAAVSQPDRLVFRRKLQD
jgi:uncharacterized protein